jgi:hypothetical protein
MKRRIEPLDPLQVSIKKFTVPVNSEELLDKFIKATPLPEIYRSVEDEIDLEEENEEVFFCFHSKQSETSDSEESIQDDSDSMDSDENEFATLDEVGRSLDSEKVKKFYQNLNYVIIKRKMLFG